MPWYFSDAFLGAVIAIVAVHVTRVLAFRDRYERRLVTVDASRTGDLWQADGDKPHQVVLSLLSTSNRATVVRDVRLVGADGTPALEGAAPTSIDP
jgi:hypothetical protein